MISQIPTPQRSNNKVIGEFYPLQKDELIALRQAKLINNAAFVHLALRYENPFCDRPIEIQPKDFAIRWYIPESSVYEAIGKLKKLGVLLIKRGKVIIDWVRNKISIPVVVTEPRPTVDLSLEADSDTNKTLSDSTINSEASKTLRNSSTNSELSENLQDSRVNSEPSETLRDSRVNSEPSETLRDSSVNSESSENLRNSRFNSEPSENLRDSRINSELSEDLWDSGKNSEIPEKILRSQNNLQDPIINSEISENRASKPLSTGDYDSLQTIQTIQTNQTNQTVPVAEEKFSLCPEEEMQLNKEEKSNLKHLSDSLAKPKSYSNDKTIPQNDNDSQIPAEVKAKLEKLNIPLDSKVKRAIDSHHISQVKGAFSHIENTWESIKNPKGVFLYQLPKQPIETEKKKRRYLTAADFGGYTIEHLKVMYPATWREAAIHFGLEVPEEERE